MKVENGKVVVPIVLAAGVPVVEAFIDDRGPYLFVLDTGAGLAVISEKVSRALDLPVFKIDGVVEDFAGLPVSNLSAAAIKQLRIGHARFNEFAAIEADLTEVTSALGLEIGGILGMPVFHELLWSIDYVNQQMVLTRGELDHRDVERSIPYVLRGGIPVVPVAIGGETVQMELDTGTNVEFQLDGQFARQFDLMEQSSDQGHVATLSGKVKRGSKIVRIKQSIVVAGITFKEPIVYLTPYSHPERVAGTIGGKSFANVRLIVDQKNRRVAIQERASRSSGE